MRVLGDAYVQSEFQLHKSVTKVDQLDGFFKEWNQYLAHIEQTARARESRAAGLSEAKNKSDGESSKLYSFGADLDQGVELTEEQKTQLENLREEASKVHKE